MRFVIRTLCVCLAISVWPYASSAQSRPPDSAEIDRMTATEAVVAGAERVVVGRIVSIEPLFFTNEHGDQLIISRATVAVDETLKGPSADTMDVMVEGGSIGKVTFAVSDYEPVAVGQRVALMLTQHQSGLLVPHLRGRGIVHLDFDDGGGASALTLEAIRSAARKYSQP